MQYLLGIDIGTSSCKVAAFDVNGQLVDEQSADYPTMYPQSGWAEQDPQDWWNAVCKAVRNILSGQKIHPQDIAGVGLDGQSWSAVAVDTDGHVLANSPIWLDTRAEEICAGLRQRIGDQALFALSGNRLQPQYTTGKILWYQSERQDVYQRADKILQSNSYIAYKLTGAMTQDISQGYGLHCFNIRTKSWDFEMCRALGIRPSLLPELTACDTIIGVVQKEAARQTGLLEGTPVIAGGLDAACAALGTGVIRDGQTQEQGGQAGGMSIMVERCIADPTLILSTHVIPNGWLLQGGTTGGSGVMRWVEAELAGEERERAVRSGDSVYDLLAQEAAQVPAGCNGVTMLPYMAGERSPIWNPNAKGVIYGLDFSKTRAHMIRAAMESVAYSLRHNLHVAEKAGARVVELRAMGGSSNSEVWMQIKSDVTGKPIRIASVPSASALGAAMLAGVGIGVYRDYDEAVTKAVTLKEGYHPAGETAAAYQRGYEQYLLLYRDLEQLMDRK